MLPLVVGVGAAAVGAVLTPIVVHAGLDMVGFGADGPVAGTTAAGMQASIGNVVTGSLFATAQSIAMGGPVPAVIIVAGAGITGVATAAVVRRSFRGHGRPHLLRGYKYKYHSKPFSPGPCANTAGEKLNPRL
ncbi:hypothetical protein BJV74DRAFT_887670 [Russula compacta]|nr:hypothetical protein BJV74DRAFT_887670 [Russula compacta]